LPKQIRDLTPLTGPLNASLAAEPLQSNLEREGAALAELPDALIVAPPGNAKLQAFVLIRMPSRLRTGSQPSASDSVLVLVGEVDDGRSEYRPVARELDPPGEPKLLLVAKILDVGSMLRLSRR
jgi:hypothetical protein